MESVLLEREPFRSKDRKYKCLGCSRQILMMKGTSRCPLKFITLLLILIVLNKTGCILFLLVYTYNDKKNSCCVSTSPIIYLTNYSVFVSIKFNF